ncbi:CATRA system-associated protein [Nonomuraea sp. NPDC050790]|uniref:CATRA system-associated protein n=1 Tax=Nonomuraea sp. NPDC050790 TaxID=3364371 RepID=UPI003797FEF6
MDTSDAAEIRAEAVSLLERVTRLKATEAGWNVIETGIDALVLAEEAGDLKEFEQATRELEILAGNHRAKVGTVPAKPAPPPLRVRVDHLIHTLKGQKK